jgi:hypothetical protein
MSVRTSPDEPALLRCLVQVTAGFPDLVADLQTIPPRSRPDRLRSLALIGLVALRGAAAAAPAWSAPSPSAPPSPAPDAGLQEHRLRLLKAIGTGED